MPAIKIFRSLTTAPLASDDMHIACIILGVYRAIQFVCLLPLGIHITFGGDEQIIYISGKPIWCYSNNTASVEAFGGSPPLFQPNAEVTYGEAGILGNFYNSAIAYFVIDVAWMVMMWASASIGTPTQPYRRDKYVRNLVKFKMFLCNIYPLALMVMGVYYVYILRHDNYSCGEGGAVSKTPDEGPWYGLFCALMFTYAIELFIWPAILTNKFVDVIRMNRFWDRNSLAGKAERFELNLGLTLKLLSCIARGKAGGKDLKNSGELQDFASHVMCLFNNEAKTDLVLSDVYVGAKMLSRVQGERKVAAIKKMAKTNKFFSRLINNQPEDDFQDNCQAAFDAKSGKVTRRPSMLVLQMKQGTYEVGEREVLHQSNASDQNIISDAAHYAKYASHVYVELPTYVIAELLKELGCTSFRRELKELFRDDPCCLDSIGMGYATLCYSNFFNGIVATPYSILVDDEKKSIVLVVRGTRSLEDLVVDLQFVPESMEKSGEICGFDGAGAFCHKGFLARCKWIYNDIKKNRVLKTLYSEQSPFKDYLLVLCGHSLGAGCASILSVMLRPSFPLLKCFAYEPPGCIFDEEMSEACTGFITSFVRHDDFIPRLSYQNFETLREEFFCTFKRIKVPKIELYFHLKKPYSERFVAVTNAQVLRNEADVDLSTEFNKQLEQLRAERVSKNSKKNMKALFIPGKIIHLVDISGVENRGKYCPYWAKRGEFNQLELSKRMYADHDIHSLVSILSSIDLSETKTTSLAFHNASNIYTDDEDAAEADIRLFKCCNKTYGKLPFILCFLGMVDVSLLSSMATKCDFFRTSFPIGNSTNQTMYAVAWGLYEYERLDCVNSTGSCAQIEDFTQVCVPYPTESQGGYTTTARIGYAIASISFLVAYIMTWVSTCFVIEPRTWNIITVLLLLATFCDALLFVFKREFSILCADPAVTCELGIDAITLIAGSCITFVMAIGTAYLGKTGKKHGTRVQLESPTTNAAVE